MTTLKPLYPPGTADSRIPSIGEPFLVACLALRGIPSFSPCEIIDPGRRVDGKIDTTEASILQRGLG